MEGASSWSGRMVALILIIFLLANAPTIHAENSSDEFTIDERLQMIALSAGEAYQQTLQVEQGMVVSVNVGCSFCEVELDAGETILTSSTSVTYRATEPGSVDIAIESTTDETVSTSFLIVEDNSTYREDGLTIHKRSGLAFSEMSEEQLGALRNEGLPKEREAAAEELIRRSLSAQTSSTPQGLPKVGDVGTASLDRLPNIDNTVSGGGLARLPNQEVPATSVLPRELTRAPEVYVPNTEDLVHEPSSRLYSELTDDMLLRIAALSGNRFERAAAKAELLRRR